MTQEARDSEGETDGQRRQVALGGGLRVPYPHPKDAAATAVGKANRRTGTKPETALRSALHRRGLRFRRDYSVRPDPGRPIRVDVAFPKAKLAVLVDGCFWHACPEHGTSPRSNTAYWAPKLARNVERDRETNVRLTAAGWEVLRVWEHVPVDEAANLVASALARRTRPDQGNADHG